MIAQSSGSTTRIAQMISTPCEQTLRVFPSLVFFSLPAGAGDLDTGAGSVAATAGGVSVAFTRAHLVLLSSRPPRPGCLACWGCGERVPGSAASELQPLAPAQPHHDGG